MMISICIPYVRPQNMEKLIERILDTVKDLNYEIVTEEDKDRIGCPQMLKRLVAKARGDLICFIGDDTYPEDGWLNKAVEAMATLPDGWGVVGFNSQESRHAAHFLADKRILPLLGGEFFSTEYKHCWCDHEITDIAADAGRFVFCDEARIVHNHPVFDSAPVDEDYNRVYSKEYKKHDWDTYCRRKRERIGFKLGIGFPIVDEKVYLQFMLSFITLDAPPYTLLLPKAQAGRFHRDIASVRNSLVEQALVEGCSHLLMMDSDQIYRTEDTIKRLIAHDLPVVSAPVHRRYPPFDPILLRGKVGAFERIPEEEAYSGDLIKIDATGTGCILYKTEIFNTIPGPWFELSVSDADTPVGEDIGFCMKLKKEGIPVYVDTSINISHMTSFEVNRSTHRLFKSMHQMIN